ncbi:MAG TPA: GNAT family N-acetyltransferase [Mycobacteriales bacterium]|nr:GNAT family N-acetyltransferase [Mycobacteriales bacterium]
MGEATFRVATDGDVAAVVALIESAYRGDSSRAGWTTEADLLDGRRTDPDAVRSIVAADDRLALLAVDSSGGLLGCCELRSRSECVAYFGMFAVVPTLQGGGIGKAVLDAAEHWVRRMWGATRMEMTVLAQRDDLIAWYERRGYQRTGETEPFPYDDVRFGLPKRPDLHFMVLAKDLEPGD